MKKITNNTKGITLIALVITIIVLLILAGVSITALTDKDGIINQAKQAKEATRAAQLQEEIDLWEVKQAGNMDNDSIDELIQKLKNNGTITQEEANKLKTNGSIEIGDTTVTLGEYSWNATNEKYFRWGSDTPGEEGYSRLIGVNEDYASELPENIVIPQRCKEIYQYAFIAKVKGTYAPYSDYTQTATEEALKNIKSIKIPNTVTTIGISAFKYCSGLQSIQIPDSVVTIGVEAFSNCTNLSSITLSNSLASIQPDTFWNCTSLTSIEIPASVQNIGNYAFAFCYALSDVEFNSGLKTIGSYIFMNCYNLTDIELPSSLTTIGSSAFYSCSSLISVQIPSSVTSIGTYAFGVTASGSGSNSISSSAVFRVVQGSYADTWLKANKRSTQTIQYI